MSYRNPFQPNRYVTPLGKGGYSFHFTPNSRQDLNEIREFQHSVNSQCPGWMARIQATPGGAGVLHVFPATDLPAAMFGTTPAYRRY